MAIIQCIVCFVCIAETCFFIEMEIRRDKGEIDESVILLTVEDPKSEVGSGGATLNALLVVAEYISAKQGYTV